MTNILAVAEHGPVTIGYIAGIVALVVLVLVGIVILVWGAMLWGIRSNSSSNKRYGRNAVLGSIAWIIVVFGAWLAASWPLKYDYHHWVETSGVVKSIGTRLVTTGSGDSKGIGQKYVFRFEDGRLRAVNDTAAAVTKEGDVVKLRCKRAFEWGVPQSSNGWDCKWAGIRD